LAPDLDRVALLVGSATDSPWGRTLEIRRLSDGHKTTIWDAGEIHSVAWDGDQALVVLARAAEPNAAMGLYRIPAGGGQARSLANLSSLPDGAAAAHALRVSPDRRLLTFLVSSTNPQKSSLYGVRADGLSLRSLMPADTDSSVTQYAWLPPADAAAEPRLLMLAKGQLAQLTLTATGAARLEMISELTNTDLNDMAVAPGGQVAVLARVPNSPPQVYLRGVQDPASPAAPAQMLPLTGGTPLAGSLEWAARGQYLVYRVAEKSGERLLMVDVMHKGAPITLMESMPRPAQ
ncbi:MAG TPA: hypothetical protein VM536_12035, partial [Chloroflexia bacterium]|nr:hypothetical protein [Chloroflexia bacterium]